MKPFVKNFLIFVSLTLPVNSVSAQEIEAGLSASDILSRVIDTYGNLDSYQDRGQVITYITTGDRIVRSDRPFTTAFIRPGKFRFEYQQNSVGIFDKLRVAYIVWQDGDELAQYFYAQPDDRSLTSLDRGIASATGISGGSAHAIPALLMPDRISGRRPTDIPNPSREEDEYLNGNDFFVISGGTTAFSSKLWVSKSDFLIRKIERYFNQQSESRSIILYKPSINQPIDPELLDFNVPQSP